MVFDFGFIDDLRSCQSSTLVQDAEKGREPGTQFLGLAFAARNEVRIPCSLAAGR